MRHLLAIILFTSLVLKGGAVSAQDLENTLLLELKDGTVTIQMYPEKAPKHVKRIKELARQGFYDGVVFHRVIDGFMAQTGDPTGTGSGGSGTKINAEFNDINHSRGIVSMARAASPNSADSQFFIVFDDASFLDGQYTAWGKVTDGMDHVDSIKKGDSANNGSVTGPDKVISIKVAADAGKKDAGKKAEEAKPEAKTEAEPQAKVKAMKDDASEAAKDAVEAAKEVMEDTAKKSGTQ